MSLHRCLYSGQNSTPVVHSICGDTAQDGAFSILRRYPSLLSKEAPPATPRADLHQSDRASRRHSPMLHLPMSRPNSRDMQAWSSVVPLHLLHCAPVPLLRPATTLPQPSTPSPCWYEPCSQGTMMSLHMINTAAVHNLIGNSTPTGVKTPPEGQENLRY